MYISIKKSGWNRVPAKLFYLIHRIPYAPSQTTLRK